LVRGRARSYDFIKTTLAFPWWVISTDPIPTIDTSIKCTMKFTTTFPVFVAFCAAAFAAPVADPVSRQIVVDCVEMADFLVRPRSLSAI
jgi:hypothetical protein